MRREGKLVRFLPSFPLLARASSIADGAPETLSPQGSGPLESAVTDLFRVHSAVFHFNSDFTTDGSTIVAFGAVASSCPPITRDS
jgi:hypothetical protein